MDRITEAMKSDEVSDGQFARMTEAQVQAYQHDVMRRIADLALIPPRLNTSPLPEYDYDRLDYGMTIGIERTPGGLSEDDGATWQGGLVLDERSVVTYPDGFQAPDGAIHISYDRNRATDGEILLARFTEEDIAAKRLVGANSRLKMRISRPLALRKLAP